MKYLSKVHNREQILRIFKVMLVQSQIEYQIHGTINTNLLVVKAQEENWQNFDAYLGWKQYSEKVSEITIHGNHSSIILGENAILLVESIRKWLKQ